MASRFFWYELMTTDVVAAENFYKAVVGWTSEPFGGSDMPYTIFNAGEQSVAGMMLLPEEAAEMGTPPCWLGYIHAADTDAATRNVEKAGGSVHRQPSDIPGVGRFSVVADPQGAVFMLMTPMGPDSPPVPGTTPGHVGWHELYAADYGAAFDFYAREFGWTRVREVDMGEAGNYLVVDTAGADGDVGMMNKPPQMPSPFWQFYFTVPDISSVTKRITENGGTITFGPMEVPGGSWVVNAQDPQGAHFALVAAKK
ncbi:MAG: VOC family protein [Rhizobiaceae bacterium]|nr:VOC family protein [Rhizobiaceae bacterium]